MKRWHNFFHAMHDALIQFTEQFRFGPVIEGVLRKERHVVTVVGGMGGSHLAAGLLNAVQPSLGISVHTDYGLPPISEYLSSPLFIASSYSGNTEETLDFARQANDRGYRVAVVTSGGTLLEFALEHALPFVRLPFSSLPPRMTVGSSALALALLLGERKLMEELSLLAQTLDTPLRIEVGKRLASTLIGKIPLVYASARNFPLAHLWKNNFNETAKIPAFCNMVPEANHNEIEGFNGSPKGPHSPFQAILLTDSDDHPRVLRRMAIMQELYEKHGVPVSVVPLTGTGAGDRIFGGAVAGMAAALALASIYGNERPEKSIIETLKEHMVE